MDEQTLYWLLAILIYTAFSIVVGVAADTGGRAGFGYFLLAIVTTPLFAGLLVLALGRNERW